VISTDGSITGPATRAARLPVSIEVLNASTSGIGGFLVASAAVLVEELPRAHRASGATGSQATVAPAGVTMLALRPAATVSGIANDGEVAPHALTVTCSGDCRIQLIAGATLAGGAWAAPDSSSIAEVNSGVTPIPTPGDVVGEFTCGAGTTVIPLEDIAPRLRVLADGSTLDSLAVVALSLSGGNISVRCGLTWKEFR